MLGKLFSKKKREDSHVKSLPPLSSAIVQHILSTVGSRAIPSMPAAAQKAFQLSTDPNAEARDFIEVIESDEGLSARVLKIANSVFFDRGKRTNTIDEAVTVIGINELRSLLNATTLSELFPSSNPNRNQLWVNDLATAIIGRSIAERFAPSIKDLAFMAGLMHDIGKLLLLQRAPDLYSKVLSIVQETGIPFSSAEEQIFPFTHTEVGQLVAEQWKFSPELIAAIRGHHSNWPAANVKQLNLQLIIQCADTVSHALGYGLPKNFGKFQNSSTEQLPQVWSTLGIEVDEQANYLSNLHKTVNLEIDLYKGAH